MDRRNDGIDFGNRESETRTRMVLKKEKKNYEEHVERAQEARDLAAELQKTYETARSFNAADYKKLERLEKLTRRVRNEVGGSKTDADPKELPRTHDEAVSHACGHGQGTLRRSREDSSSRRLGFDN